MNTFIIKRLPVRFTFDNNYFKGKIVDQGTHEKINLYGIMARGLEMKTQLIELSAYNPSRDFFKNKTPAILTWFVFRGTAPSRQDSPHWYAENLSMKRAKLLDKIAEYGAIFVHLDALALEERNLLSASLCEAIFQESPPRRC